jgi:hypothetical protein
MNIVKSALRIAAVALGLAISGCASLPAPHSNDVLVTLEADSQAGGQ